MSDYSAEGNYYTIGHIVQFTGLTDRTIRNYIASGILQGEKINGLWHFTAEQVDAFMHDSAVRPSILAKNNAIVYDFLLQDHKTGQQGCMILDFPGEDVKTLNEYFCRAICDGDLHDFRFTLDCLGSVPRVILSGRTEELMDLVACYYESR